MNNEKIGGHGVMQSFAFLANLIALMLLATTLTFAAEHQVNSADVLTNAATATDSATNHAKSTTAPSLIIGNRAPLQTPAYLRLPAGAVAPHGWLRRQLPVELAVGDEIRFVVDPNGSNGGDYTLWDTTLRKGKGVSSIRANQQEIL